MSETPFKTPRSHFLTVPIEEKSDSEESTASGQSEASSTTGSTTDLTIIALYDDLMRLMRYKREKKVEDAFLHFAEETKLLANKYVEAVEECRRLQVIIDMKVQEGSELEIRLKRARNILDEEKKKTHRVIREREELEDQLDQVRELLFRDNRLKIGEEAKAKLAFLSRRRSTEGMGMGGHNLSAIREVNSTGSMLSDFSVSRSEDDLDEPKQMKGDRQWKKHRPSTGGDPEPATKKRRSSNRIIEIGPSDTVRATTTLTVNKKGPIRAISVIESVPISESEFGPPSDEPPTSDDGIGSTAPSVPPSHLVFESWGLNGSPRKTSRVSSVRQHNLQPKTLVMSDSCICCEKRIRFGRSALKCKECKSICHSECKDQLPLPCIPVVNTPTQKNLLRIISDYTPTIPPMVPALIVHCINEIELRGLKELGLYRLSASEKEVKMLKEKFLKGRGSPCLNQTDLHVVCSCVKDFLRCLTEPLVTYALWRDFVGSVEAKERQDVALALQDCVAQLPQPNRDTLAYVILHLQKVAESPECKMPIENLAKVFGPTIVGFSTEDPNPNHLLTETRQQIAVMEQLIRLPSDYWSMFVNVSASEPSNIGRLQQTPSTDSLLKPNGRFFASGGIRKTKKQRLFATPPAVRS